MGKTYQDKIFIPETNLTAMTLAGVPSRVHSVSTSPRKTSPPLFQLKSSGGVAGWPGSWVGGSAMSVWVLLELVRVR